MKTKTLKIEVPTGYEIDREKSTFENIVFKKLPEKDVLPETWEEFCKVQELRKTEYYISPTSEINTVPRIVKGSKRLPDSDGNVLHNKHTAKALLAYIKLIRLRDCYNKGWKPNWKNQEKKYIITSTNGVASIIYNLLPDVQRPLAFRDKETAELFFEKFIDLIKEARMFL